MFSISGRRVVVRAPLERVWTLSRGVEGTVTADSRGPSGRGSDGRTEVEASGETLFLLLGFHFRKIVHNVFGKVQHHLKSRVPAIVGESGSVPVIVYNSIVDCIISVP